MTTPLPHGAAPATDATVLARVVSAARQRGPSAIVVFDLDSTLLDNRPRQAQIMREYGNDHAVAVLTRCQAEHWQGWDARIAMRNAGLDEAGIEAHHQGFRAYWLARFFTSSYCVLDHPIAGAVSYVGAIRDSGAQLAYVTGRHEEMRAGTLECFSRHGIALPDDHRIRLLMKPTLDEHDDHYKVRIHSTLRTMGTVVAAFDNEPTHINGYREAFPDALSVHLVTDHSSRDVQIAAGISRVSDFAGWRP